MDASMVGVALTAASFAMFTVTAKLCGLILDVYSDVSRNVRLAKLICPHCAPSEMIMIMRRASGVEYLYAVAVAAAVAAVTLSALSIVVVSDVHNNIATAAIVNDVVFAGGAVAVLLNTRRFISRIERIAYEHMCCKKA